MSATIRRHKQVPPEGCEICRRIRAIAVLLDLPEEECEALAQDATLRELVHHWSTLDESMRQAILTIARQNN